MSGANMRRQRTIIWSVTSTPWRGSFMPTISATESRTRGRSRGRREHLIVMRRRSLNAYQQAVGAEGPGVLFGQAPEDRQRKGQATGGSREVREEARRQDQEEENPLELSAW